MIFTNWNQHEDSIFIELEKLMPDTIIEAIGSHFFDFYYYIKYGDRIVPTKLLDKSNKEVSELLHAIYSKRWTTLTDIAEELAYFNEFDKITIIDEKNLNNTLRELTSKFDNNVTGFDTNDTALNTSDDESILEKSDVDNDKQYTRKEKEIKNIDIRQQLIDNTNIVDIICSDVKDMVSLEVY